jgi:hypothetical protein
VIHATPARSAVSTTATIGRAGWRMAVYLTIRMVDGS